MGVYFFIQGSNLLAGDQIDFYVEGHFAICELIGWNQGTIAPRKAGSITGHPDIPIGLNTRRTFFGEISNPEGQSFEKPSLGTDPKSGTEFMISVIFGTSRKVILKL